MTNSARGAVVYTRISRDREGEAVGVKRQQDDCLELAARSGLEVLRVYTDNDISASTLSRKVRPGFQQMVEDIRQGNIGTVFAYSNSRLTRRPLELEDLIKLHEATGVVFHTKVSGMDDLSTADGRMVARIKASVDAAEAERTGERLRAAHRHLALNGKPFTGGSRPFGWEKNKVTVIPEEAELIRTAAQELIQGSASLTGIAGAWNALGVKTVKGNEWTHKSVKDVLASPKLAGFRVHHGEVMKKADGAEVEGAWGPILTRDEHYALVRELTARQKTRRKPTKLLLSPKLMCGRCGAKMIGTVGNSASPHYRCSRSWHLTINLEVAEHTVYEKVALRIAQIVHFPASKRRQEPDVETKFPGDERLDELQAQTAELMEQYNLGRLKGSRVFPQVEANDQEIDRLLAERQAWMEKNQKRMPTENPFPDGFDLSVWTSAFNTEVKDAMVGMACQRIIIKPSGKSRSIPTAERVEIVWHPSFTPWMDGDEPPHREADLEWMRANNPPVKLYERELGERGQQVMKLVAANPKLTGREVAESLGISRPYAQKLLREAKGRQA